MARDNINFYFQIDLSWGKTHHLRSKLPQAAINVLCGINVGENTPRPAAFELHILSSIVDIKIRLHMCFSLSVLEKEKNTASLKYSISIL